MSWPGLTDAALETILDVFDEETVEYLYSDLGAHSIRGAFSNAHIEVEGNDGVPVSSVKPILLIKLSELQRDPREGDRVSVNSRIYRIIDAQPDGEGGAVLVLHKVS